MDPWRRQCVPLTTLPWFYNAICYKRDLRICMLGEKGNICILNIEALKYWKVKTMCVLASKKNHAVPIDTYTAWPVCVTFMGSTLGRTIKDIVGFQMSVIRTRSLSSKHLQVPGMCQGLGLALAIPRSTRKCCHRTILSRSTDIGIRSIWGKRRVTSDLGGMIAQQRAEKWR